MRVLGIGLAAACVAVAVRAHAQDAATAPPSETLEVTATRVPTDPDDISAGITVIDAATIAQRGYTTLVDALSAVAGAHVVQSGGPGGNASLFVRGTESRQVQVLVDGVPVNDAAGPGEAFNFGVDTLADVARIEVVRGPMSALYGSGAIGGVVNIITVHGSGAPHATAQATGTIAAGAPRAVLGQVALHGARGAFDYAVAGESRSDEGFDATPAREAAYTGERDGYRTRSGSFDVGYTPVAGTRLFADVRGRSSVFGFDDVGGFPTGYDDPDETGRDNDFIARGGVTSLLAGLWHTSFAAARDQEYRRYTDLLDTNDPTQSAQDSRYVSLRSTLQWNNVIDVPDIGALHDSTVTAGYEHVDAKAQERLASVAGGYPYDASVDASDRRDSGYAGVQGTIANLALTGALRQEQVSEVGGAFTWRAGGSYAVPAIGSHFKASYGTAFLAPSLFDRYGIDSFGYVGNPALLPERSHGYEIGWVGDIGRRASLETTYFHTHVRDLIQTVFVPVYTTQNVGAARLQGVETTLHLHPADWIDVDATYTYTNARDRDSGQQLLRRPYDSGSVTLALQPLADLSVVPQIVFAGGDRDALVDDTGSFTGYGHNGGGVTANLNVAWQIDPRVRLFAWGKNLTHSHAEAASGYAPPGPSVLAGVRLAYP